MKGIILAAGRGSKFWPYNEVRNKCATRVANRPAIRWLAEHLLAAGADGLVVVVGHLAQSVRGALHGVEGPVTYIEAPPTEGTALAALRAAEVAEDDELLLAYGDIVTERRNVVDVVNRGREADRPAVLAAPLKTAGGSSGDWIDFKVRDGELKEIWGHPRGSEGHVMGGVAHLRMDRDGEYLRGNPGLVTKVEVGGMPAVEADLSASLQLMIESQHPVAAVESTDVWCDLDKPWHILRANYRWVKHLIGQYEEDVIPDGCTVDDSADINGRIVLSPGAKIGKRVVINGGAFIGEDSEVTNGAIVDGPTHIGRECRVRHYCQLEAAAIGDECILSHAAEFCGGVAFERVYFYHYMEIAGVVGASVDFGAATVCGTLRFDDGLTTHRIKGRAEVPSDGANVAYFGDYSRTGVNAIIMPGVKTGAYSLVGPGVILYEDLPSRKAVFAQQEHRIIDWGPERYGW
ncbi:MAG: NTP transferase domain-containing protein [Armatimonadia bacterium]|nr:NTP transferase domain-containing protein [Armatimonadia bacterium]